MDFSRKGCFLWEYFKNVEIILIIGEFKKFVERIIGKFKSIIDLLSLYVCEVCQFWEHVSQKFMLYKYEIGPDDILDASQLHSECIAI